jgi:hypothetical protein
MLSAQRVRAIVFAAILCVLVPRAAHSQGLSVDDRQVQSELATMGQRGGIIARSREQILTILQSENACSAWFRESESDSADVFRSVHYEIDKDKPAYVFRIIDSQRGQLSKHPWVARSTEYGGRNSTVELNPNAAFFNFSLPVLLLDSGGATGRLGGFQVLTIASFRGGSNEAQLVTLLHELGHIVGRIPEDSDSWDGRSSQNTLEVLRYCKDAIRGTVQKNSRRGN